MTASRRRRWLSRVGLLVVATSLLAACGDSGKELNTFDRRVRALATSTT
jgi:hypothetical protein